MTTIYDSQIKNYDYPAVIGSSNYSGYSTYNPYSTYRGYWFNPVVAGSPTTANLANHPSAHQYKDASVGGKASYNYTTWARLNVALQPVRPKVEMYSYNNAGTWNLSLDQLGANAVEAQIGRAHV